MCVYFVIHLSAGSSVECVFVFSAANFSVMCDRWSHINLYKFIFHSIRLNKTSACLSDYLSESTRESISYFMFALQFEQNRKNHHRHTHEFDVDRNALALV